MKKFIKIALLVLLLVIIAGAGVVYYFTSVKEYDVADKEVDKIIEDPYSIAYPEATPLPEGVQKDEEGLVVVDKDGNFILEDGSMMSPDDWFSSPEYAKAASAGAGNTVSANAGSDAVAEGTTDTETAKDGVSADGSSSNASLDSNGTADSDSGGSTGSTDSAGGGVTVDIVKSRYADSFSSLEGQVDSQLGSLISQAKTEYAAKKAAGETVNPAYFYQKYSGAASGIESKTDAAFNSLYTGLTSELKANGFSESHAEQFKADYEATKEARKNELLSKVAGR